MQGLINRLWWVTMLFSKRIKFTGNYVLEIYTRFNQFLSWKLWQLAYVNALRLFTWSDHPHLDQKTNQVTNIYPLVLQSPEPGACTGGTIYDPMGRGGCRKNISELLFTFILNTIICNFLFLVACYNIHNICNKW